MQAGSGPDQQGWSCKAGHTVWGCLFHKTSSEDNPLIDSYAKYKVRRLHKALQASAGWVDLIQMIRHTCAIETGN